MFILLGSWLNLLSQQADRNDSEVTLMWFHVYVLFLIASGVLLLGLAGARAPYARRRRTLNIIVGAGFLAYGLYLLVFFRSGHYVLFFYVFVLPVLLAVRFFRDRSAYRAASSR